MKNEKTQLSIVQNTGKYKTAAKIQEFTGFTGPLGSLHARITRCRNHDRHLCLQSYQQNQKVK